MINTNTEDTKNCPACNSTNIESNKYGLSNVCEECGYVLNSGDTESKTPDLGDPSNDDPQPGRKGWMEHSRVTTSTENRLAEAYGEIENIATKFSLPVDLRKEAAQIYNTVYRAKETAGRSTEDMIAACVRIASKQANKPIPRKRLIENGHISSSAFQNCILVIHDEIDGTVNPIQPEDYIWFLSHLLGISKTEEKEATELLTRLQDNRTVSGKNPSGVAAAVIYNVSDSVTQNEAADAVGVSPETIRRRRKDINEVAQ